ncbi:MAG: ABC transporter substrate-binding protein [Elstera sp.]
MKLMRQTLAAFALALGLSSAASAQDLVRLGNLKFAHYGAISYMKEIAAKYDLKIEEHMFAKGLDIMPAIVSGQIDIAASAMEAAVSGRAGGAPIYAVAGFAQGGARFVVGTQSPIKSVADLKGKRVGVTRGATQEMLLFAELEMHGLTASEKPGKDVTLIYMAFADLNQALMAGNIDAMSQSEPQASQAISLGFGRELLKPYDTPLGPPIRTLVMTEDMYTKKKDVARRVLECFVEATAAFMNNPALAEKYVRESMFKGQLSSQDFRDAIENSPYTYNLTTESVQLVTDAMQRLNVGRMSEPPVATEWVKLEALTAAKKKFNLQ